MAYEGRCGVVMGVWGGGVRDPELGRRAETEGSKGWVPGWGGGDTEWGDLQALSPSQGQGQGQVGEAGGGTGTNSRTLSPEDESIPLVWGPWPTSPS